MYSSRKFNIQIFFYTYSWPVPKTMGIPSKWALVLFVYVTNHGWFLPNKLRLLGDEQSNIENIPNIRKTCALGHGWRVTDPMKLSPSNSLSTLLRPSQSLEPKWEILFFFVICLLGWGLNPRPHAYETSRFTRRQTIQLPVSNFNNNLKCSLSCYALQIHSTLPLCSPSAMSLESRVSGFCKIL